ncbi:uncharacterized protein LOC105394341 isoform X1 [Plutella xylostella]|uniref:uncharacterized protein LOC105394341 isoform X1 n=1 Tax=Plutella xylostella TaxID=51655 RepID=UPI00203266E2|nr:uncharacterized protein LOC105394341 isoform X1 [Plutella xylostella]
MFYFAIQFTLSLILLFLEQLITLCLLPDIESSLFSFSQEVPDDVYTQPINFMSPKKTPHEKSQDPSPMPEGVQSEADEYFSRFSSYIADVNEAAEDPNSPNHNRIKRKAKAFNTLNGPTIRERPNHYLYPAPVKDRILDFSTSTKRPATLLPDQLNPGVVFRVRMADAILRIKQRMYEDPERHIESDIIYTNLIKKVVMDEITKFHNLLLMYKTDKSIKEHLGECGGRIYKFISYMTIKVHIYCLFDALWIDGNPYVIGDEYSVTPVEVPPLLQCDAAECNSIVFVDSITEPKDVVE